MPSSPPRSEISIDGAFTATTALSQLATAVSGRGDRNCGRARNIRSVAYDELRQRDEALTDSKPVPRRRRLT
jgi:hypothetical protein